MANELDAKQRVLLRYPEAKCSESVSLPVCYGITIGHSPFFESIGATEEEAWKVMASKVDQRFAEGLADLAKTTGGK